MLSVEIAERNFCSHCRSVRELSLEKPVRPGSASCCAQSVHATKVKAASVTKLRRIFQNLTKHPRPTRRDYTPPLQYTKPRPPRLTAIATPQTIATCSPGRPDAF